METRIPFLDHGIQSHPIYPTLGLFWTGVDDPELDAAHCRADKTWALEMCTGHIDRLYAVEQASLSNPG